MGRWPARVHGTDCAATASPRGGNFAWDSPGARHPSWLSTLFAGHRRRVVAGAAADLGAEPDQRIVLATDHAFLHGDYRVVGDLDVFRADLGAALGDVAEAHAEVVLRDLPAVGGVGGVHLQFRDPHQEPGAGEGALVIRVVADDVAHVLAQEALDALAELLRPLHVGLLHPELAGLHRGIGGERRDLERLGVVERHVRDQVPDHREGAHRGERDGLARLEGGHPRHAREARPPVDLHRAGPALAGLAVPADRQVAGLGRLEAVQDVQHNLALVDLDLVVGELPLPGVAPPDPQRYLRAHLIASLAGARPGA